MIPAVKWIWAVSTSQQIPLDSGDLVLERDFSGKDVLDSPPVYLLVGIYPATLFQTYVCFDLFQVRLMFACNLKSPCWELGIDLRTYTIRLGCHFFLIPSFTAKRLVHGKWNTL